MNKLMRGCITVFLITGVIVLSMFYGLHLYQQEREHTLETMIDKALRNVQKSLPPGFSQTNQFHNQQDNVQGLYVLTYQKTAVSETKTLMVLSIEYKIKNDWLSAFKERYDFEAKTNMKIDKSLGALYYNGDMIKTKGNIDTIGNIQFNNETAKVAYSSDLSPQTLSFGATNLRTNIVYNAITQTVQWNNKIQNLFFYQNLTPIIQLDALSFRHDFNLGTPLNGESILTIAQAKKLNTYQSLHNLSVSFKTDSSKHNQNATMNINIEHFNPYEQVSDNASLNARLKLSGLEIKGMQALEKQLSNILLTPEKSFDFSGYARYFIKQGIQLDTQMNYASNAGSLDMNANITIPLDNGYGLRQNTQGILNIEAKSDKNLATETKHDSDWKNIPQYGTVDFLSNVTRSPNALPYNKKQASFVIRYRDATSTTNGVDSTQSDLTMLVSHYLMTLDTQWALVQKLPEKIQSPSQEVLPVTPIIPNSSLMPKNSSTNDSAPLSNPPNTSQDENTVSPDTTSESSEQ